jgi:peptide/nickel transport system permease protein
MAAMTAAMTAAVTAAVTAALCTILLGGFLSALLIRAAPGYGVDERELDPRLRADTIRAIRQEQAMQPGLAVFYVQYLRAALHGDLGVARSLNRPVAELFAERLPVTVKAMGIGLALSWLAAASLALAVAWRVHASIDVAATLVTGATLAIPAAVMAVLFLLGGWPPGIALAAIVFPRIFRYLRSILVDTMEQPHVLFAQAKGLGRARVLAWHVLPVAAPRIAALAGISVSLAFSAVIPVEVVCDSPGFGQLAWLAAQGRDLPLLVGITVLVTVVTIFANAVADLFPGTADVTPS